MDPAIQAIIAQSEYGVLQRVGNYYWGPCTTFIDNLVAGKATITELTAAKARIETLETDALTANNIRSATLSVFGLN